MGSSIEEKIFKELDRIIAKNGIARISVSYLGLMELNGYVRSRKFFTRSLNRIKSPLSRVDEQFEISDKPFSDSPD